MKAKDWLNKPEYFFRPKQLFKRVFQGKPQSNSIEVALPWGHQIRVNPFETIGKSIYHLGVYEMALSELVYRALSRADHYSDIGANIGYFSSLGLSHDRFSGPVFSFEPHPEINQQLTSNLQSTENAERSQIFNCALSDRAGTAELFIPQTFDQNEGISSLIRPEGAEGRTIEVELKTLDSLYDQGERNIVLKIDVEGAEASVLKGSQKLLEEKRILCVFFEEFEAPEKAESIAIMRQHGYDVYRIENHFFGPNLAKPESPRESRSWEPINFVAIQSHQPLFKELQQSGWQIF